MNAKALTAIILIASLTFATLAYGVPTLLTITGTGTIPSIYKLTSNSTTISWGNPITLDVPISKSLTITNEGTKNVTKLTMNYTASPNLHDYSLTWNCENQTLPIGHEITATWTLTVTEAADGLFTITINIADKG